MARKRMFDIEIINQDSFYELPMDAKALYFLLGMEADDEGFINPKKILRLYGGTEDSIKILIAKGYLIPFKSGVVVITDWKRNNYLDKNKIKETIYIEEKESILYNNKTEKYEPLNDSLTKVKPELNESLPSIEENRVEENRVDKYNIPASEEKSSTASVKASKHKYGEYKNVLLKDEELQKLKKEYPNWEELIKYLDEYIEMKGYKAKSHYLCIGKWVVDAVKRQNKANKENTENIKKLPDGTYIKDGLHYMN